MPGAATHLGPRVPEVFLFENADPAAVAAELFDPAKRQQWDPAVQDMCAARSAASNRTSLRPRQEGPFSYPTALRCMVA